MNAKATESQWLIPSSRPTNWPTSQTDFISDRLTRSKSEIAGKTLLTAGHRTLSHYVSLDDWKQFVIVGGRWKCEKQKKEKKELMRNKKTQLQYHCSLFSSIFPFHFNNCPVSGTAALVSIFSFLFLFTFFCFLFPCFLHLPPSH